MTIDSYTIQHSLHIKKSIDQSHNINQLLILCFIFLFPLPGTSAYYVKHLHLEFAKYLSTLLRFYNNFSTPILYYLSNVFHF